MICMLEQYNCVQIYTQIFKLIVYQNWVKVICRQLLKYLTNFPYKLLWTIMDTLWTVVITQPQSIVVGKHFTVTIIKLLNVISQIPIIHLLPIYFCTSSWNVRAAICLEGHLSLLALSSVYSLTVEDVSWSTPMVPAQLSVPLQQVEEWAPKPVRWTMCFLLMTSSLAWTLGLAW